ncbi:MAG: response regulator transcription factor [Epsilonproteobacteria bacterium]|uniref:response regulator transcription factor n=1 Tax=Sulfurospirillum TaxID=57665 RepID=UPI00054224B5|nr:MULTISPECIES: response regulator transcription factor [Sulfurospirillum]KHG33855.1 MAG: chemotaxis protein CheY [Sulfurospirillum sp. MES]MCP3652579.1 response regulator transcription factor [Sulfurospirillum sp. DNRA8]MCR1811430.1 response regulator transcription factor [Sulfurospirillum sp. DNRA8]NCB54451.1 response regulator transcription factor [Campylobacterota bacterium]
MKQSILIIEDEEDLLELLEYHLQKEGYETLGFLNTKNVEKCLNEEPIDLLIVDRNLPGIEGSEFVESLRKKGFTQAVIFVTAKNSDTNVEEGFLRGGDDYVTKPYNMKELLLRIKAVLARTSPQNNALLSYRDLVLDLNAHTLHVDAKAVELTKLEFDLLRTLIENKSSVLSREFLLEHVWKNDDFFQDKTVNVAINRLKQKIDPTKEKEYIKSIWGVGYSLC